MRLFIGEAYAAGIDEIKTPEPTAPVEATIADPAMNPEDMARIVSPEKMMMDTLFFLLLLFCIFYFILIRPQQKRIKAHQEMLGSLNKGVKVVTGGGIIGTVVKTEGDDIVLVEIAPNVKVRIAKGTISEVLKSTGTGESANDN